jgi:hypothetical protein
MREGVPEKYLSIRYYYTYSVDALWMEDATWATGRFGCCNKDTLI